MPITSLYDERSTTVAEKSSSAPAGAIIAASAGMAAAWIAAGSIGLLAHPFRHALCWIAILVAVVAAWPRKGQSPGRWLLLAIGVVLAVAMTASNVPVVNVLAVVVVLAALSRLHGGVTGRVILLVALAAAVLGVFRFAYDSVPAVYLASNAIGRGSGWLAGNIARRPLEIGATFAGIDFLVLMAPLYVGWLIWTSPPRPGRAIFAALAIVAGQFVYLIVLAFCCDLLAALPDIVLPPPTDNSRLGVWAWGNAIRTLLPWNLPVVAAAVQITVAAVMFRWSAWLPPVEPEPQEAAEDEEEVDSRTLAIDALRQFGPILLAVVIPLLTVLSLSQSTLKGKRVVAYRQGYLDWLKPEHEGETAGMYGMLPLFVESLGGRFGTSADLSQQDLAEADVLLLLHPDRPWPEDRLNRVWDFVRGGGSLLLAAGPRILEGQSQSNFNAVLRPTAMRVRYDTAVSPVANWEHTCDPLSHPATAGIGNCRNRFGLLMGSSLRTRLPASPLLVGRFAYSDPGSDAAINGVSQYEPGEKLGDLVLAAEQRLGKGRIVVLGDSSCLHNDVIANAYMFSGRLLGYLAGRSGTPQAWWRQLLGLAAAAALVAVLAWRVDANRLAAAAVALAVSLICCTLVAHHSARVLPDGRNHSPNNLAYIDASHLEAYSSDQWHDEGTAGLARTLMRNGYLALMPPELTSERLERAGLLLSIGPARPFSHGEREAIGKFVEGGGTFICMVGSEEAAPSRPLLADFGFYVAPANVPPTDDTPEAEPLELGSFRQIYVPTDDNRAIMQTYAAWEVESGEPDAELLMLWSDGKLDRPFVVSRSIGGGTVTVIGDTHFAANKNLEGAESRLEENIHFWRWLLSRLTGRGQWIPPKPVKNAGENNDRPQSEVSP